MKAPKLGIVFGTRPEIIKLAPIIWSCKKNGIPFFCIHTGQHFSDEMDKVFFQNLALPEPEYRLEIGSRGLSGHGAQTGVMLAEIEDILRSEKPDMLIVQGDTNSVLAGALAAAKIPCQKAEARIKVVHIEAGLRSYDRRMPEETNRIITDHISDILFAPTENQKKILVSEGIEETRIFVTGNTIVDAIGRIKDKIDTQSHILERLGVRSKEYILLTAHRQENVDSRDALASLLDGVSCVAREASMPIIFPMHPRTERKLHEFGLMIPKEFITTPSLDYFEFVALQYNAKLILTDSGGVQEEACILGVPCVTLRDNTERPETIEVGANCLAGVQADSIIHCFRKMYSVSGEWRNPFGDGKASERIIQTLLGDFESARCE